MSRKSPVNPLKPINVNRRTWMYPERRSLCLVREVMGPEGLIRTEVFSIPWSKIERAVSVREVARKKPRAKA